MKARTPRRGGQEARWRRRGGSVTPLGRSHQSGRRGVMVDRTMISLVLRFQSPEV